MSQRCCTYNKRRLPADDLVGTDLLAFLNLLGQADVDYLPSAAPPSREQRAGRKPMKEALGCADQGGFWESAAGRPASTSRRRHVHAAGTRRGHSQNRHAVWATVFLTGVRRVGWEPGCDGRGEGT